MKRLHIHRWKTTDLLFEQPIMSIEGIPIAIENNRLYWDFKIKKCKCGKEKKVLINFYTADRVYTQINDKLISLQLVNKQPLI